MNAFLYRMVGRIAFRMAIVSLASAIALPPSTASAEPRFGDSTWVAPYSFEGDPEMEGPRVAAPDRERTWETVVRAPFRLAFLPFRMLARGVEATGPLAERLFPPGDIFARSRAKPGFYFSPEIIGATVGYRGFAGPGSKAALTGTWSVSSSSRLRFRSYVGEGVSAVGANLNALYERKTNRHFFGMGNDAPGDVSYFLRRSELADAHLFLGRHPLRRVRVGAGFSDIQVGASPNFNPDAVTVFDPLSVPFLTSGTRLWWYGASADFAALDDSLEPTGGIHFRPMVRRYQDLDDSGVRYDQWRLETRGYAPVFAKHRVLAARFVIEGVDPRSGSAPIPFYRLAEAGDDDAFAAYSYGRFRDRRLALGRMEYRWEIMPPIWAFLLGELGEVAPTASAFTLRDAHRSLGGGIRAKAGSRLIRLALAHGEDGLEVHGDLRSNW